MRIPNGWYLWAVMLHVTLSLMFPKAEKYEDPESCSVGAILSAPDQKKVIQ